MRKWKTGAECRFGKKYLYKVERGMKSPRNARGTLDYYSNAFDWRTPFKCRERVNESRFVQVKLLNHNHLIKIHLVSAFTLLHTGVPVRIR